MVAQRRWCTVEKKGASMSVAKRLKVEGATEVSLPAGAEIIVDLGNGLLGHLHTHGSEDTTIQEHRWQQFKNELYQSHFWQQYKERLDSPDWDNSSKETYEGVIQTEIQRAWDESRNGKISMRMPQTEKFEKPRNWKPQGQCPPDIPLAQASSLLVDVEESHREIPEVIKDPEEGFPMGPNGGRLQRYLVTVEYLGSRFLGWQKQKHRSDLRTVQGALEDAFNRFVGQPVVCGGSSRTDSGVHALANVCHVDVERVSKRKPGEVLPPHEPEVVKRAVNHFLQKEGGDMMVVDVRTVHNDFHARFQARERTYHYRILAGSLQPSIFEKDRAWHVSEELNLAVMQEACQVLVGNHDFSSFRAAGCQAKSPLKTLDELHVCELPVWHSFPTLEERILYSTNSEANKQEAWKGCTLKANDPGCSSDTNRLNADHQPSSQVIGSSLGVTGQKRPCCFVITARARSFLYHQVRLLVGTIKAVGCGGLTVEDVGKILAAKSIKSAPAMAPACGLYLANVKYDFNDFKPEEAIVTEAEYE